MIDFCNKNLNELGQLLVELTDTEYAKTLDVLSNASVGQHVRHILEFYVCLLDASESSIVNYDLRKRKAELENRTDAALQRIGEIQQQLSSIRNDRPLTLLGNYSANDDAQFSVPTTLYRELAYNLEHSIHHQALIKIGVNTLNRSKLLHENFGIAPATVRHRNTQNA